MDVLRALGDLITRVNNPLANSAPLFAVALGLRCLWVGYRTGTGQARFIGAAVCVAIVTYTATLRVLLQFNAIGVTRFLELSAVNVPLIFSAIGYLFYSRSLADRRRGRDRETIRRFREDHPDYGR